MGSMNHKQVERDKAVKLRQEGKTYNEILKTIPVAKSTLSLWLRDIGLAKIQKQKLTAKKIASQKRGGESRHLMRISQTEVINIRCKKDIESISRRELFLLGIALYWAEGAKKSKGRVGTMIDFANSDPDMLKLFIKWLSTFTDVDKKDINLRLHIHDNHRHNENEFKTYWSKYLSVPLEQFMKSNYKKHNPRTKRSNTGQNYRGLISIRVKRSTELNRRILGWIYAIISTQT
jgi:hypothetical protein